MLFMTLSWFINTTKNKTLILPPTLASTEFVLFFCCSREFLCLSANSVVKKSLEKLKATFRIRKEQEQQSKQ